MKIGRKYLFSLFFSLVLFTGLVILASLLQKNQDLRTKAAVLSSLASECTGLTISPTKPVYKPGEKINITAQGFGDVANIKVYYMGSTSNLTHYQSGIPNEYSWKEITGSFDLSTKVWTGSWTLPGNGEYVIAADMIQSDGFICSGNPGYTCSGCEKGTAKGGEVEAGIYSCDGCQKIIAVSSSSGAGAGYDMKKYWNLASGNIWDYEGISNLKSPAVSFTTRWQVEEKVKTCGYPVYPVRITKDKKEGYCWPGRENNLRWLISYFEGGQRWSSTTVGALFTKLYSFDTGGTGTLSTLGPEDRVTTYGRRNFTDDGKHLFENAYYAPYIALENNIQAGWSLEWVDKLFQLDYSGDACNMSYAPTAGGRYWKVSVYDGGVVSTPAYTGKTVRISYIEAGTPVGARWYSREDWYLAEGIGLVKLEQKKLAGLCPDPNCDPVNPITDPLTSMKLKSYYLGGSLSVTATVSGSTVNLKVTGQGGQEYNGKLEVKGCKLAGEGRSQTCTGMTPGLLVDGAGNTVWIQDGRAGIDLAGSVQFSSGTWRLYFRPVVEKAPSDAMAEEVTSTTQLPWSNMVTIPLQGSGPVPTSTAKSTSTPVSGNTCNTLDSLCKRYGGMFCQMAKSAGCR